jgi:hypothetical protein
VCTENHNRGFCRCPDHRIYTQKIKYKSNTSRMANNGDVNTAATARCDSGEGTGRSLNYGTVIQRLNSLKSFWSWSDTIMKMGSRKNGSCLNWRICPLKVEFPTHTHTHTLTHTRSTGGHMQVYSTWYCRS